MAKRKKNPEITQGENSVTISVSAGDVSTALDKLSKKIPVNTIVITGAVLKSETCKLKYDHHRANDVVDECTNNSSALVHADLKKAFSKLTPHLAVKCEQIDASLISDIETIEKYDEEIHEEGGLEHKISMFHVYGFQVQGVGENEGVILTGSRTLSTGEDVTLISPKITWDSDYLFVPDLQVAVDNLKKEVLEYHNGKTAPFYEQGDLFEEEEKEDDQ